jgi:hypothetical protein
MRINRLICVVSLLILLSACTATVPVNYSPSSILTVHGSLNVGQFDYLPAEDEQIDANQIKNTALGSVRLDENIDDYFRSAAFTEMRFVGIEIGESSNILSGQILEFVADDLGYHIDWILAVNYQLLSNGAPEPCFDATYKTERRTNKFVNVVGALDETLKLNIEEVLKNADFKECIAD